MSFIVSEATQHERLGLVMIILFERKSKAWILEKNEMDRLGVACINFGHLFHLLCK